MALRHSIISVRHLVHLVRVHGAVDGPPLHGRRQGFEVDFDFGQRCAAFGAPLMKRLQTFQESVDFADMSARARRGRRRWRWRRGVVRAAEETRAEGWVMEGANKSQEKK